MSCWSRGARRAHPGRGRSTWPGEIRSPAWARSGQGKKIAALEEEQARGGDPELVRQGIVEVALAHRLISRHTSLVAVEEIVSRMPGDPLGVTAVPNLVAHGQVMYPRTATSAPLTFLVGCIAALFALVVWRLPRQRTARVQ